MQGEGACKDAGPAMEKALELAPRPPKITYISADSACKDAEWCKAGQRHLSSAQGHYREEAAAAALQDGAHSTQKPLLPTLSWKVIGHPVCGFDHNCSIARHI